MKIKAKLKIFWHLFVYRNFFKFFYRKRNLNSTFCFLNAIEKRKTKFERFFKASVKPVLAFNLILIVISAQVVNLSAFEGYVVGVEAKISNDLPGVNTPGGKFCIDNSVEVELLNPLDIEDSYISYTTDGSIPVCNSLSTKRYKDPFYIDNSSILKARTCYDEKQSAVMAWIFDFALDYCDYECGNDIEEGNEECDDGNTEDGDGCSSTCQKESVDKCGDGNIQEEEGEECDDGNLENGDGCSSECKKEECKEGAGIVVLDTSGSIGSEITAVKEAAKKVVDNILDNGGEVGYIDFDSGINIAIAPSRDKVSLFEKIDLAESNKGENTNTAEAFRVAEEILDNENVDYKFVVFITDGNPYIPGSENEIIIETKEEADDFKYAKFGVGVESDGSPPAGLNLDLMKYLFGEDNYFNVDNWENLNSVIDDMLIKMCPIENPVCSAYQVPEVEVLIPNGGEIWKVGETRTIEWTATDNYENDNLKVDIYYSNDSGDTWASVKKNLDNTGSYDWRVPVALDGYYITISETARVKIEVKDSDNELCKAEDVSDADFCPPIECSLLTEEELELLKTLGYDDCENYCPGGCDISSNCTLTQGYWKTHSKYGQAPEDDDWGVYADEEYLNSGFSYYEVINEPVRGRAWYILAHQHIATWLNYNQKETEAEQDILDALDEAGELLENYVDAKESLEAEENSSDRERAVVLAGILADYNEGLIGPGHCSNEPTPGKEPDTGENE